VRVDGSGAEPLPQKPADHKPMSGPGDGRQPSVVVQVGFVPGLQQCDRRGAARRRWRNDRFLFEILEEDGQRRCGPALHTSALFSWPQEGRDGHRDLTTTQRYMHLSPNAVFDAIRLLEVGHPTAKCGDIVETAESR
jgi:hypothetical protein